MDAIILSLEIGEDHRLVIDLPPDVPSGPVQVTITPQPAANGGVVNPAREAARAKLLAAGLLKSTYVVPPDFVRPPDEQLQKLVKLPPGSPSIDEIIDEDRGPR